MGYERGAALDDAHRGGGAGPSFARVRSDVQHRGEAVDSARALVESLAADGAVHGEEQTAVLRITRLQPLAGTSGERIAFQALINQVERVVPLISPVRAAFHDCWLARIEHFVL